MTDFARFVFLKNVWDLLQDLGFYMNKMELTSTGFICSYEKLSGKAWKVVEVNIQDEETTCLYISAFNSLLDIDMSRSTACKTNAVLEYLPIFVKDFEKTVNRKAAQKLL